MVQVAPDARLDQHAAILDITQSQAGLLVIDRMVPARHMYNCVTEIELAPGLGPDEVRRALATVVALQPALREVFADLPAPHAVLTAPPEPGELPLTVVDRCDDAAVEAAVADLGAHRFELRAGPLYRFTVLTGPDRTVLVMVAHHLVFDGFSLRPLLADLTAALSGAVTDVNARRAERDEALRRELGVQRRVAASGDTDRLAREWAGELREVTAGELYPRPYRPARTARTGRRVSWRLGPIASAGLAAACARLDVTPFVFFAGVYGLTLARHTAASTAVIGSPVLARHTAGAFDLSGFFVNTLPVVLAVDWSTGLDEYLGGTCRDATDRTRSRADVAFNQLVTQVRPDRSSDRNAIFSAMLAMQDVPAGGPAGPVRAVRERDNGTAKFDAWLGVTPLPTAQPAGDWLVEFEHDTELLPAPIADGFVASLRGALDRAATADSQTPVADLFADASSAESTVTDGHRVEPPADDLIAWLRHAVARWPDRIAIDEPGTLLTYRQLDRDVRTAAAGLLDLGVAPGDVVGIALDRLTDTVVAMLAILRRGAAFLPLDASLPAARIAAMLRRAGCRLVVGALAAEDARTVALEDLRGDPVPDSPPAEAVYVMFSSGSTGEPKGIRMGQPPLVNLTAWQIAALDMGEDTRFLQYAPLGFDVSFQEIVPTLAAGGTVVSREPVDRRDLPGLVARLAETDVTHVYLPVAAVRAFVEAATEAALDTELPRLRYVCASGEQLSVDDRVRAFFDQHPHTTLVNLYGPTETHAVTTHRLRAVGPRWPAHVPIGVPLTGVAAYLVDVTGHLAPAGVVGDLHLGGACPAHGYINRPDLTAAAFLPDRFGGRGTIYRTGDQVLRDTDGALIFLGRADEQVKIRGYRVELGEIEVAAAASAGVTQAVAAARGTGGERELVLFLHAGPGADPDAVAERLRTRLPAYMVPARVFVVDAVPKTANGKVDRPALLRVAADRIAAVAEAAPATAPEYADEIEAELAALWTRLIDVPDLPREKSLLECGAHSLTVFTALSQVRREYGVDIPIIDFFRTPTIAALAAAIHAARGAR